MGTPTGPFWKYPQNSEGITTLGVYKSKRNNIVIPYVSELVETLRRILSKRCIPMFFKPVNTIWQKLVHQKASHQNTRKAIWYILSSAMKNAWTYTSEKPNSLWTNVWLSIGEQTLQTRTQRCWPPAQGQGTLLWWFRRGEAEAIYVKVEKPSPNTGGGLWHHVSPTPPQTMLSFHLSPGNLTNCHIWHHVTPIMTAIHTWDQVTQATVVTIARSTDDPSDISDLDNDSIEVKYQSARTKEASWMRSKTSSKNLQSRPVALKSSKTTMTWKNENLHRQTHSSFLLLFGQYRCSCN